MKKLIKAKVRSKGKNLYKTVPPNMAGDLKDALDQSGGGDTPQPKETSLGKNLIVTDHTPIGYMSLSTYKTDVPDAAKMVMMDIDDVTTTFVLSEAYVDSDGSHVVALEPAYSENTTPIKKNDIFQILCQITGDTIDGSPTIIVEYVQDPASYKYQNMNGIVPQITEDTYVIVPNLD